MFRKPQPQTLKADHTSRVSRCAVCVRRQIIEENGSRLKPIGSNGSRYPPPQYIPQRVPTIGGVQPIQPLAPVQPYDNEQRRRPTSRGRPYYEQPQGYYEPPQQGYYRRNQQFRRPDNINA